MNKIIYILLVASIYGCKPFNKATNSLYLVGDSTMSEKRPEKRPETGWGEMLGQYFTEGVSIENHAKNGRSTSSFIAEKRWESVVRQLKKGDHVFIQFGHNDAKRSSDRYASPEQYKRNLLKFVREVREKGGIPVLLTPVVRRRFDAAGNFYDTHGKYPEQVRQLAREEQVTCFDLHRLSARLLRQLGEAGTKPLFLILDRGAHPNYPEGIDDNTHFSPLGASKIAEMVAAEIQQSRLQVKKHLAPGKLAFRGVHEIEP